MSLMKSMKKAWRRLFGTSEEQSRARFSLDDPPWPHDTMPPRRDQRFVPVDKRRLAQEAEERRRRVAAEMQRREEEEAEARRRRRAQDDDGAVLLQVVQPCSEPEAPRLQEYSCHSTFSHPPSLSPRVCDYVGYGGGGCSGD